MKKIFILTVMLGFLGGSLFLLSVMPYHFYSMAITQGIDSPYLKLKKYPDKFYVGNQFNLATFNFDEKVLDKWGGVHFSNFEIPFPIKNPNYLLVPEIEYHRGFPPVLGAKFVSQSLNHLFSFRILETKKYVYPFESNKIFSIPVFQNMVLNFDQNKVWKDIFSKNMEFPFVKGGVFSDIFNMFKVPYEELVYNLFVLKLRSELFSNNLQKLTYIHGRNIGIASFKQENKDKLNENIQFEKLFILENGLIYTFNIFTDTYRNEGKDFRDIFIRSVKFKTSNKDSSIPLYSRFKDLPYERKIDQEGMTYLYAGWSHVPTNEQFLKQIIFLLERGDRNIIHLEPLYEYAYKKYGSNFSRITGRIKEVGSKKLERKISEEFEASLKKEKDSEFNAEEGNFETKEEKINFFLKRAKEKNNQKDSSDMLIVD